MQALDVITRLGGTAVLVELPGTHSAAAAAVQHRADAWRARGGRGGAGALLRATAAVHLGVEVEVEEEGERDEEEGVRAGTTCYSVMQ